MEFREEMENQNIRVTLVADGNEVAKATCYFENTPKIDEKNIGCIGEFEASNTEYGVAIIKRCEKILKEKNVSFIAAPINGNTWKKYRVEKYSRGDDLFLMENVNPVAHNEILMQAGFNEIHKYSSTKGLIKDAYYSEAIDIAEQEMKDSGITFRKLNKETFLDDLKMIYSVSKVSFARNPLYTEIDEENFLGQYTPYVQMIDDEFVLLVEKDGKEIGFVFCIPDYNEMQNGKSLKTLILKTIAVLPEYENYGIGNVLLSKIAKKAMEKGYENWIFAFMHCNNTSQKMAKRNKTETIREYVMYGKEV